MLPRAKQGRKRTCISCSLLSFVEIESVFDRRRGFAIQQDERYTLVVTGVNCEQSRAFVASPYDWPVRTTVVVYYSTAILLICVQMIEVMWWRIEKKPLAVHYRQRSSLASQSLEIVMFKAHINYCLCVSICQSFCHLGKCWESYKSVGISVVSVSPRQTLIDYCVCVYLSSV